MQTSNQANIINDKQPPVVQTPKTTSDAMSMWVVISRQLQEIIGKDTFDKWFRDVIPLDLENNLLTMQTNGNFNSLWIQNNYTETIQLLAGLQEENLIVKFIRP